MLIVGEADRQSLARDLVMLPRVAIAFAAACGERLWRTASRRRPE